MLNLKLKTMETQNQHPQLQTKSLTHLTTNSPTLNDNSISIYQGTLSKIVLASCIKNIRSAFPELPAQWYDVFTDRIKALKFNDDRLINSVNNVIDTYTYKNPPVALFISFDTRIKFFSYSEAIDILTANRYNPNFLKPCKIPGHNKPKWCYQEDIEKYNIELWNI
jgi:hypothetical protein